MTENSKTVAIQYLTEEIRWGWKKQMNNEIWQKITIIVTRNLTANTSLFETVPLCIKNKKNFRVLHLPKQWRESRCCDLTPKDFFLWGYLNTKVYVIRQRPSRSLKTSANATKKQLCRNILKNFGFAAGKVVDI